jgi:phosphonate transport system ATP-binding protein
MVAAEPLLDIRNVCKSFGSRSFGSPLRVLDNVSLSVAPGEMVALIGASGSGKSTLIRAVAGLVAVNKADPGQPTASISLFGRPMQCDGRLLRQAKALRARVGVVFQQFNLVPRLSVLTNVCLGHLGRKPFLAGVLGRFTMDEKQAALRAMARVGIDEHALKRGSELSGGQQQRAAIARALVQKADILIADEPIASLDPHAAKRVMDLLADLNRRDGTTIVVSLHQVDYAIRYCPRTVALKGGRIVYDGPTSALTPALLTEIYGAESSELFLPRLDDPSKVDFSLRDLQLAASAA